MALKQENPIEVLRAVMGRSTQKMTAETFGISQSYLSDLLNGRREFSDAMLEKLAMRRIVVSGRTRR